MTFLNLVPKHAEEVYQQAAIKWLGAKPGRNCVHIALDRMELFLDDYGFVSMGRLFSADPVKLTPKKNSAYIHLSSRWRHPDGGKTFLAWAKLAVDMTAEHFGRPYLDVGLFDAVDAKDSNTGLLGSPLRAEPWCGKSVAEYAAAQRTESWAGMVEARRVERIPELVQHQVHAHIDDGMNEVLWKLLLQLDVRVAA